MSQADEALSLSPSISPSDDRHGIPRPSLAGAGSFLHQRVLGGSASAPHLPLPATTPDANPKLKASFLEPVRIPLHDHKVSPAPESQKDKVILQRQDENLLMPSYMPPKYHIFDLFPFSLLVKLLTKKGSKVKGKKAARLRAKMRNNTVSHNLPLEISLYLVSDKSNGADWPPRHDRF